ncbi:Opaque endosperm10 [Quillaja saponaria]|uniref:Opaque endosperm10 n=1 Tax=Quillaja saponaria TaxID=32244 RepID=A0AAD7PJJ7_QUISA|nr:Opaque endosperm10 [Quillaja saponaria]
MGIGFDTERVQSPEVVRIAGDSSPSSAESSFRELDDAFLQTQTRIWLGEVLQIRLDEQLVISELLADGELLFEVSNVVWKLLLTNHMELKLKRDYENEPFALKKSIGRYTPYSNVDSFLKICKIVGLAGIDLISPSDVVEKRNTRRVCMCIRSFSKNARTKNLNVPDFDVVTYTVAMPKDMVGFIRRSLEVSQSSLLGSANNLQNHASEKFGQGYPIASFSSNFDKYSVESDDTGISNAAFHSDGSSTNCSYDSTSRVISDSEDSEMSTVVKSDTGEKHISKSDILSQEKTEDPENLSELLVSNKLFQYPCSQNLEHVHNKLNSSSSPSSIDVHNSFNNWESHLASGIKLSEGADILDHIYSDLDPGYGSSIVENLMNGNTTTGCSMTHRVAIPYLTGHEIGSIDSSDPVLLDGENTIFNIHESASSHGSNSTPRTIEIGRRLFDVGDNLEVTSATSKSCVSGEAVNLEGQFDAEDDSQDIHLYEVHNGNTDFLKKKIISRNESQTMIDRITPDAGHSSHYVDAYLHKTDYFGDIISYDRGSCMSHVDSFVGYEDKTSPIISRSSNNVGLIQCEGLPNEADVSEMDSSEKTSHDLENKAFMDPLAPKLIRSIALNDDEMVDGATMVKLDSNAELNNHSQAAYLKSITDERDDGLTITKTDDTNGFHDVNILTHGVGKLGRKIEDIVTSDLPSSCHNVVGPAIHGEHTPDTLSCLTNERLKNGYKNDHITSAYDNDHVVSAEQMGEAHSREATKCEDVCVLSVDNSDETVEPEIEVPKGKPHKRLLLKSVVGGTAAFGLIYLLLHLRQRRRYWTIRCGIQSW